MRREGTWNKVRALFMGAQLAAMAGSLIIGAASATVILFNSAAISYDIVLGFGLFFFYALVISLVIVNASVLLLVLPWYLLFPRSIGPASATVLGGVSGFVVSALMVAALFHHNGDPIEGMMWFYVIGIYLLPGTVFGALVGLFAGVTEQHLSLTASSDNLDADDRDGAINESA